MADKVIVIRGGMVQNDPGLPILDCDVLGSQLVDDDTVDEVRNLMGMATKHEQYEIAQEAHDWLVEHGKEPSVELGDVRAPAYEEEW